jgi:DNA-binding transcriptional MerR regulator
MVYTVKKVAEISGISVRTLHFYDELGLLKPAYHGSNGARRYGEKELLILQQILFFKELGLSLKQISKILKQKGFDPLSELHSHKKSLQNKREKISKLLQTLETTIEYLQGKKNMKDQEFFHGFSIVSSNPNSENEKIVLQNLKKQELSWIEKNQVADEGYALYRQIAQLIKDGLDPSSEDLQTSRFHHATKEVYVALAKLYVENETFKKQLDFVDPNLAKFLAEAMQIFAQKQL